MKRVELVKLLELVQPALSDTDLVPVFTHFMFCDGAVSASNDGLSIVAASKVVQTEGSVFAIKGSTLLGLLKNSAAEEVTLEESKDHECVIKTGRSVFSLPYLTEDAFLFEAPGKERWLAKLRINEALISAIKTCLTTASKDHAAAAIMGVCFNLSEDELNLYSCDGDAITQCALSQFPYEGLGAFTVPTTFCEALLKISGETKIVTGSLEINPDWVKAVIGDFTIYGRMTENKKPLDHANLIKKTLTGKIQYVPLPDGFNEALARARVVADVESKPTTLIVEKGKLLLITETSMGVVRDELSIKGHSDVQATAHAELIQRSVGICDTIAIKENCTAYKLGDTVLQIVSNIGE